MRHFVHVCISLASLGASCIEVIMRLLVTSVVVLF